MKFFKVLLICIVIFSFSTCFYPLDAGNSSGDEGIIRISLPGDNSATRALVSPQSLDFELDFSGPGKRNVNAVVSYGESVSVRVVPGLWEVVIKAYEPGNPGVIKAIGAAFSIDVRAGKQNNVPVKMAVYTEVNNWSDLDTAINTGSYNDFIVINGPVPVTKTITINGSGNAGRIITLASKNGNSGKIERSGFNGILFDLDNNINFVLGSVIGGYNEVLTIDGENTGSDPFFDIKSGSSLVINNAVLKSNANTAVYCSGSLVMNAGAEINSNVNAVSGKGGAVYINNGSFIMNDGKISGNNAFEKGGGVYVTTGGTFAKTGGTIYGYAPGNSDSNFVKNGVGYIADSGHAVYVDSHHVLRKESTAGPTVNLFYDGVVNPPAWGGGWELTSSGLIISLGIDEFDIVQTTAQVNAGASVVFTAAGTGHTAYQWYLDGVPAGTSASYIFNQPAGVYEVAVVVTGSTGKRSGSCRVTAIGVMP